MASIRDLFRVFLCAPVVAVGLSSGAALAADKHYTATVTPTSSSSPATLTFKFTNSGNSSFNSLSLTIPAGYAVGSFTSSRGTITPVAGGIQVNTINLPTGSGQFVTVTATGVTTSGGGCSSVSGQWLSQPWTGTPVTSGNKFMLDGSVPTTTVGGACYTITSTANPAAGGSVSCSPNPVASGGSSTCTATANALYTFTGFSGDCSGMSCVLTNVTSNKSVTANFVANVLTLTSPPTSAALNVAFDVTVANNPDGASISLIQSPAGCATLNSTAAGASSTTFNLTISNVPADPGTCAFTGHATNYADSQQLVLKVYKGVLACGDYDSSNSPSDPSYDPDLASSLAGLGSSYVGPPGWGLRRGPNKNGASCVKINYSCDLDATTNVATCSWDKASGQQATFKYLFLWSPKAPDASGWTTYRPQVSWPPAPVDATFSFPNWAPAVACVSDTFPILPVLPTNILPLIPNAAPFSTDANNTLAQYQPNAPAWVCVAQQGWTAVGAAGNAGPGSGTVLLQHWIIVIDEADIRVSGP